jgi:hypothetical protein
LRESRRFALRKAFIVAGLVLTAAFIFSSPHFTAAQQSMAKGEARAVTAAPDFSGVWFVRAYRRNILPNEDPPFQPWAEAVFKKRQLEQTHADPNHGPDPTARCIPPGIPRTMLQPLPFEIIHARDRVVMVFEYQSLIRQIFTDGRGHAKDFDPTYMGDAIGHFEGDTLVVDTTGFNDKTWLDPQGLPHTGALHVVEHIRRTDHDTLVDDYTIEDPKAYTKPWTAQLIFSLKPDWQIKEYVCAENNKVR